MRYMLPRQFWKEGPRVEIFDENRRPLMVVRDPEFSWDHHWTIEDLVQTKLAYANQEFAMSSATYVIFRNDEPWIEIPASAFDSRISEHRLDGASEYGLAGQFWQREYTIRKDEATIAAIGPHRWAHAHMLAVETNDGDDLSALLVVMAIEQILFG